MGQISFFNEAEADLAITELTLEDVEKVDVRNIRDNERINWKSCLMIKLPSN